MNLTLQLAAWDFRYMRHYLGLWLGLVILQAVLVGYAPHLSPDYPVIISLSLPLPGWWQSSRSACWR